MKWNFYHLNLHFLELAFEPILERPAVLLFAFIIRCSDDDIFVETCLIPSPSLTGSSNLLGRLGTREINLE